MAAVVAGTTLGLTACGNGGGQTLAREACVHVYRSIAAYERAVRPGTPPSVAAALQRKADRELRAALPLAAQATSDDGTWNALMTDISESAVVDEGHLIPSLRGHCVLADANTNVNPQSPGGTTPQNVNPKPAS